MEDSSLLEACSELLSAIVESPENQKCFDCTDKFSPKYLCTNFSIFVCSCCANIHKEFGHTIKCLNVFVFSLSEMYLLKDSGNKVAADKWLALWMPDDDECCEPDPTSPSYREDARKYMSAKYIEQRWCLKDVSKPRELPPSYAQQHDNKASTPRMTAHACDVQMDCGLTSPFPALPGMQQYMSPGMPEQMTFPPCQYVHPKFPTSTDLNQYRPHLNPIPFQLLDRQTMESVCSPAYGIPYEVPPPLPPRPATYEGRALCRSNNKVNVSFSLSPPPMETHLQTEEMDSSQQSSGMFRSASENSLGASMRGLNPKPADTHYDKGAHAKWKVHGLMSKMADLLSPKRASP